MSYSVYLWWLGVVRERRNRIRKASGSHIYIRTSSNLRPRMDGPIPDLNLVAFVRCPRFKIFLAARRRQRD